jgi:peptide-methionine (S)-S-oxide reductase
MSESQTITLGGGCFWCTEAVYVKVRGVTDVESGYSNGQAAQRPATKKCAPARTGTTKWSSWLTTRPKVTLKEMLEIFFVIHDPTTLNRQGNDAGTQYRSGIYYSTPEQKEVIDGFIRDVSQDKTFRQAHRHRGAAARQLLAGRGIPPGLISRRTPTRVTARLWSAPRSRNSARPLPRA